VVDARRTFGPLVLLSGLASGAVAMAGTQPWHSVTSEVGVFYSDETTSGTSWAFGLVMLAALGVVLVSRGRFRRLVTVLGLLASLGAVVAAADVVVNGADTVRDLAEETGRTGLEVDPTGWLVVGVAATVLSVVAWLAAFAYVRHWPEMGKRYDAPADAPPDDLWKAMDQGHDPTS
jgi:hypothetical protein